MKKHYQKTMKTKANNIEQYILNIPEERQKAIKKLLEIINQNIPDGFHLSLNYGMPGWVVPLSYFPDGYHCKKNTPLPFINIGSQKNFIALYHMGIYSDQKLLQWFKNEYPKHCKNKLDMGKSCIRFKKVEQIPYQLIGQLCQKISVDQWINIYQKNIKK